MVHQSGPSPGDDAFRFSAFNRYTMAHSCGLSQKCHSCKEVLIIEMLSLPMRNHLGEDELYAIVEFSLFSFWAVPQDAAGFSCMMACQTQLLSSKTGLFEGCAKRVMFTPGGRAYASEKISVGFIVSNT